MYSFTNKDLWTSVFFLLCGQLFISNWTEIISLGLGCYTLHNWIYNGWTVFSSYWGNLFETDGSLNEVSLSHDLLVFCHKGISFSTWLTVAAVDHQFCPVVLLKVEFICTTALSQPYWVCMVRFWSRTGGYRGGFCKKLPKASPMSCKANARWLQDWHTSGQGQAHQRQW